MHRYQVEPGSLWLWVLQSSVSHTCGTGVQPSASSTHPANLIAWKTSLGAAARSLSPLHSSLICCTCMSCSPQQIEEHEMGTILCLAAVSACHSWSFLKQRRLKDMLLCSSSSLTLHCDGMRLLRVPGLALYYTENIRSVPGSFKRLLLKTPVLHRTIVFITVTQACFS